ncbi:AbrB/MazE/SpoVT family DNA-binding domain-containing protein [Nocardia vinacea]|uniref:AbrB/MazE/SpoVT family DNA-binding domain-containing protein n=1 Tax=Nocardia vinacea TaxID=96468 RepID=A0ABZ1YPF4_9NOCA|nr:AbrB/MazE/SpoVT family DNA-binding domain-containing protein [Nocardia vinacea]
MDMVTGRQLAPVVAGLLPDDRVERADGEPSTCPALPLPLLHSPLPEAASYRLRPVDTVGRINDQELVDSMGWHPGDHLGWSVRADLAFLSFDVDGAARITVQRCLRLPAELRHALGIRSGDRVLLAPDPARGILVLFSPRALHDMAQRRIIDAGGELR